jgi:hypothetical protein
MRKLVIIVGLVFFALGAKAQFILDIESNAVYSGYNNIRIPNGEGTYFEAHKELNHEIVPAIRVRAGYRINCKHDIIALYAPFVISYTGSFDRDIGFQNTIFRGNEYSQVVYTFNSYRLTYRYFLADNARFRFAAGLTGKVRDASIQINQRGASDIKTDLGVVPLVHLHAEARLFNRVSFLAEGDGLWGPRGRAFDYQFAIPVRFSESLSVRAGYRILEGGADVSEVYNFSLFHYGLIGVAYNL